MLPCSEQCGNPVEILISNFFNHFDHSVTFEYIVIRMVNAYRKINTTDNSHKHSHDRGMHRKGYLLRTHVVTNCTFIL